MMVKKYVSRISPRFFVYEKKKPSLVCMLYLGMFRDESGGVLNGRERINRLLSGSQSGRKLRSGLEYLMRDQWVRESADGVIWICDGLRDANQTKRPSWSGDTAWGEDCILDIEASRVIEDFPQWNRIEIRLWAMLKLHANPKTGKTYVDLETIAELLKTDLHEIEKACATLRTYDAIFQRNEPTDGSDQTRVSRRLISKMRVDVLEYELKTTGYDAQAHAQPKQEVHVTKPAPEPSFKSDSMSQTTEEPSTSQDSPLNNKETQPTEEYTAYVPPRFFVHEYRRRPLFCMLAICLYRDPKRSCMVRGRERLHPILLGLVSSEGIENALDQLIENQWIVEDEDRNLWIHDTFEGADGQQTRIWKGDKRWGRDHKVAIEARALFKKLHGRKAIEIRVWAMMKAYQIEGRTSIQPRTLKKILRISKKAAESVYNDLVECKLLTKHEDSESGHIHTEFPTFSPFEIYAFESKQREKHLARQKAKAEQKALKESAESNPKP